MGPISKDQISELTGGNLSNVLAESFHDLFQQAAKKHPDRRAIACLHQPASLLANLSECSATDGPYLRWTHRELVRASHALARKLFDAGLRPGMRMVLLVTTGLEWHVFLRASLELGCIFSGINPAVADKKEELEHIFSIVEPAVIVAQTSELASKISNGSPGRTGSAKMLFVLDGEEKSDIPDGWQRFVEFTEQDNQATSSESFDDLKVERKLDDVIMIYTTSGTTSMPKGCPLTNRVLTRSSTSVVQLNSQTEDRVSCCHLPLNHIFAMNRIHSYMAVGGCVVHPSATFDAAATLRAIRDEGCTDIPAVPAVQRAILSHPNYAKKDMKTVRIVMLGATTILDEDIQAAFDGFGCEEVVNAFGMTENSIPFWRFYSPGSTKPVTKVAPGHSVRICDPETGDLLPVGQPGEIHTGSEGVIKEYWLAEGQEVNSPFYDDDMAHWIKTGDQGMMTEDNDIPITGRYKDLIIRGGENVAPMAIEAVLLKDFGIPAEVVGFPDEIAGEVPVAIVNMENGDASELPKSEIQEKLVKTYGGASAIESIVDIKDLGVDDYPKTVSGKVQKNVLRDLLVEHLEPEPHTNGTSGGNEDILGSLLKIWAKLIGVDEDRLSSETVVTEWADSLTLARFPGTLERSLKLSMNTQEVMDHPKISEQVELLGSRSGSSKGYDDLLTAREGTPEPEDIQFVEDVTGLKKACQEALSPLGLQWDDVEEVTPLYDFQKHFLHRRRPQSNNHRHAWVCNAGLSKTRKALEFALEHNMMLRTMAVRSGENTYQIAIRSSPSWFAQVITELEPIDTADQLKRLKWNDPKLDHAAFPGPMFRAVLAPIKGDKDKTKTGLVYMAQHSVFDGISLPFFTSDLDALLSGTSPDDLPQRVPFRPWVESFCALEDAPAARKSVQWHVERLQEAGISSNQDALFPRQRAPGWFKGDSTGWIDDKTGKAGPSRKALDEDADGVTGLSQDCEFPGISALKHEHGIDPSQVLKAALALVNCKLSKQKVAFFAQYQAARGWPFMQSWQEARMPPAMEVNGPTVQTVINAIDINKAGSVVEMLQALQSEQNQLNVHAAAPFSKIADGLRAADAKAGDNMIDVWRRQIFNWLPGEASAEADMRSMSKVQMVSRTDVGLLWNCMVTGTESIRIMPSWDDAQLSRTEVEDLLSTFVGLIKKLVERKNWEKEFAALVD